MTDATLEALQQRLGHVFAQPALLIRALTHRSHGLAHNERLEFLGDAVLNMGVSDIATAKFYDQYLKFLENLPKKPIKGGEDGDSRAFHDRILGCAGRLWPAQSMRPLKMMVTPSSYRS